VTSLAEARPVVERTGYPVMIKAPRWRRARIRIARDEAEFERLLPQASQERRPPSAMAGSISRR
jgi:biotin carboxylase